MEALENAESSTTSKLCQNVGLKIVSIDILGGLH